MTDAFTPEWLEAHRVDVSALRRDQVVGIGHVMTEIDGLIARLRDPEAASRFGLTSPRGFVFHGEPGTGKTLCARYFASQIGDAVPFYEVSADELTPERIRGAMRYLAETHPRSVLYADEIDTIAISRDYRGHDGESRMRLTALLAALDGLTSTEGPIVIAASNRPPAQMDPAAVRPGRLGYRVAFSVPSETERVALLRLFTTGLPLDPRIDFLRLARLTRGHTPAALRQIAEDAAGMAFAARHASVEMDDMLTAARRNGRIEPEPDGIGEVRKRIAVHEAGHTAACVALRGPDEVYAVVIGLTEGSTRHGDERVPGFLRPDDLTRDAIAIAFGGVAAEQAVLGEGSQGGARDVSYATRLARGRIASGLTESTPVDLDALGRAAAATLKTEMAADLRGQLREARRRARAIVAVNVEPIRRFAGTLEEAGALTGDELAAAIGDAQFVPAPDRGADRMDRQTAAEATS